MANLVQAAPRAYAAAIAEASRAIVRRLSALLRRIDAWWAVGSRIEERLSATKDRYLDRAWRRGLDL
jgi:hypothetical protein